MYCNYRVQVSGLGCSKGAWGVLLGWSAPCTKQHKRKTFPWVQVRIACRFTWRKRLDNSSIIQNIHRPSRNIPGWFFAIWSIQSIQDTPFQVFGIFQIFGISRTFWTIPGLQQPFPTFRRASAPTCRQIFLKFFSRSWKRFHAGFFRNSRTSQNVLDVSEFPFPKHSTIFRHIGNFVLFWKFPPRRGKLFHMSTVSRYCEFQAIRNIPNVANVSNVRNIRNIRNCSLYSAIHWENFRNFVDFPNFYPYTEFLKILRLFTRIYGFLKFLQLFGGLR